MPLQPMDPERVVVHIGAMTVADALVGNLVRGRFGAVLGSIASPVTIYAIYAVFDARQSPGSHGA